MFGPEGPGGFSGRRFTPSIGSEFGGPGGGGRGTYGGGGIAAAGQRTSLPPGQDFVLLRFFDFSVEPGKKYKYRVKLVLADPNFGVDKSNLAADVLDRKPGPARFADDWSEPSPTVGIPLAGSVRLAEVKPRNDKLYNDEPSAKMVVESFDKDKKGVWIQGYPKDLKDVRRGSVANFVEEAWYLEPDGRYINRIDTFKFLTGMTVLDVKGGDRLTRDINAPSRALLMGPAGELYIRNELDDQPAVENYRTIFAEPDKKRRGEEDMLRGIGPEGGGFPARRSGRER